MKRKLTCAAAFLCAALMLNPLGLVMKAEADFSPADKPKTEEADGTEMNDEAEETDESSEADETEAVIIDKLHLDGMPMPEAGTTVDESIEKIKDETHLDNKVRIDWVNWYKGEYTIKPDLSIDSTELRGETLFYEGYTYTCCMRLDVDSEDFGDTLFVMGEKLKPSPVKIYINETELPASNTVVKDNLSIFLSFNYTIPGEKVPYEPTLYYSDYDIICKQGDVVSVSVEPDFPNGDKNIYTYQWYKNTVPSMDGSEAMTDFTDSNLVFTSDEPGMMYYFCVIDAVSSVLHETSTTRLTKPLKTVLVKTEEYSFPFADVDEDAWYYKYVEYADKKGLLNGRTETEFCPDDYITLAECVKLASCMHQLFREDEVTLENGDPWYLPYVEYARMNYYSDVYDYTDEELLSPVTRAAYVDIFCYAMPGEQFKYVNDVPDGSIPDIPEDHPYAGSIYKMYTSGILNGKDEKGTFGPDDFVKRSDVAAILVRMMDTSYRVGAPSELGK